MKFSTYLKDKKYNDFITEALKIVKKLKDKLNDKENDSFEYLKLGKIDGYTIKNAKHVYDDRGNIRRDSGVPIEVIVQKIKEVYPELKINTDTSVVFTYNSKYNMIVIVKDKKYKEIKIKTLILQNRNKNNFHVKEKDIKIVLEQYKEEQDEI